MLLEGMAADGVLNREEAKGTASAHNLTVSRAADGRQNRDSAATSHSLSPHIA
jgi:hypothetical protein